jgi:hypothetical protein
VVGLVAIALPASICSVCGAAHANTVGASGPYASDAYLWLLLLALLWL